MNIRLILSSFVLVGTSALVAYNDFRDPFVRNIVAQVGGGCSSFTSSTENCGDSESCGLGIYTVSGASYNGSGIMGTELRSQPCAGTSCGSILDVPTSYFNNFCCDQDFDGVSRAACGGNDCDDSNAAIRPSATEACDGIDNNCNGVVDEGFDQDGDSYKTCTGDCNDSDDQIYPGATTMCEPMDRNCNDVDDRMEPFPGWCGSPIVIDTLGNGFDLTDSATGVDFNLTGVGVWRWSWTSAGSNDAWLVLDRNGDGSINDGSELFGCVTPQPPTSTPNGFNALTEYDDVSNGGNGNDRIDSGDQIFSQLRLWRDINHNGISDNGELELLAASGIASIDLDYRKSRRVDQHGNEFRYRAKVRRLRGNNPGRWAYDVFLNVN